MYHSDGFHSSRRVLRVHHFTANTVREIYAGLELERRLLFKDLNTSLSIQVWRWTRCMPRAEAPAAEREWDVSAHTYQELKGVQCSLLRYMPTQVFPLRCSPSIVCDRCSGAGLWWHRCGAWAADRSDLSLICIRYLLTNASTHLLFIVFLIQSSEVNRTLTVLSQNGSSSSSSSCHKLPRSQVSAELASWCVFMAHKSGTILQWNAYIPVSNFTSKWFIIQRLIETDIWRCAAEGVSA